MAIVTDLQAVWRERAKVLAPYSPAAATAYEEAARELGVMLGEQRMGALTLTQASEESGYTSAHLGRMVRTGTLRNVGRPNAPRVLRGDLPKKVQSSPALVRLG